MTTYQHDTDGCAVFVPTDTAYDLDGDGDDETPTQVAYLCDAGGANVQDLSFHTEGSCFNDFYSRDQLLSYLTNDDGKVSTLKEKFDPNFESENPGTTYINNNPNLRACGSGMYAQAKPPGTVVNATWAHPKITYPDYNHELGVDLDPAVSSDDYFAWGGSEFLLTRGSGDLSVNRNTLIGTGDLKCYQVPTTGFCMGVDWNNGVPPIENWTDVEACIKEIPCPGVSVQEDGTEIYAPTERIYTLWQYGSTTGFKNVGVDQVAESMRFKYGFCNPMPETQILAAATFGDPETRQIDNIKTESVCYGGIFSCADFLSSDDTGVCEHFCEQSPSDSKHTEVVDICDSVHLAYLCAAKAAEIQSQGNPQNLDWVSNAMNNTNSCSRDNQRTLMIENSGGSGKLAGSECYDTIHLSTTTQNHGFGDFCADGLVCKFEDYGSSSGSSENSGSSGSSRCHTTDPMNNTYRISAELDNVTMAYIDNKNFEEADWKTEVFSRGYVCEHEGDLKMIDENTCRNLNGDYKNSSLDALSGAAISNMSAAMIGLTPKIIVTIPEITLSGHETVRFNSANWDDQPDAQFSISLCAAPDGDDCVQAAVFNADDPSKYVAPRSMSSDYFHEPHASSNADDTVVGKLGEFLAQAPSGTFKSIVMEQIAGNNWKFGNVDVSIDHVSIPETCKSLCYEADKSALPESTMEACSAEHTACSQSSDCCGDNLSCVENDNSLCLITGNAESCAKSCRNINSVDSFEIVSGKPFINNNEETYNGGAFAISEKTCFICPTFGNENENNTNASPHQTTCFGDNRNGDLGFSSSQWTSLSLGEQHEISPIDDNRYEHLQTVDPTTSVGKNSVLKIDKGLNHSCVLVQDALQESGNAATDFGAFNVLSNEEQTSSNPETSDYFNDQATRYDARGSLYGRMKCWGSNSQNQLGDEGSSRYLDDSFSLSSLPFLSFGDVGATEPSDLVVLDMSLGENHTCALLSSRKANTSESGKYVRCFGSNQEQQLGNSSLTENVSGGDYDLDNTNPVQVVTGRRHTCVLKESGKVYCFGADDMGQSGVPRLQNTEDVSGTTYSTSLIIDFNPTQSERGGKAVHTGNGAVMFKQIASNASADHTCGITSQGNVFCWGANERGQCGTQPSWENLDLDTFALPLRSDASQHSDLRSNSTPSTSGFLNHNVKFPLKDTKNLKGTATQISVGGGFSCALVEASEGNTFLYKDGSKITINPTKYVTCWGDNTWGQLGVPNVDETPSDKNVITGDNLFQIMLPNGKVNQENKKIEYYNPFASTSLNCILDSQSDFCENNIGYNHDIASISTGKAHACITATNKNSNGGQNDVFCFGNNNKQQTVSSDVSFYGNESGHMGEDLKALELERYCKSNSAADVGSNADGEIEDHFAPLIKKIGDNSVCMISGTDLITQERGFSWPIFKTLNECEQDGRSCHPMILDANPNKVHFIPSFGIKNSISPAMDVENCPSGPVDGDFVSSNLEIANAEACVIHGTTLEPIPQNGYFWPLYGKSACESKHDTCVPKVFKEHPEEVFYTPLDQTVNSDVDISSLHACHLHGSSY